MQSTLSLALIALFCCSTLATEVTPVQKVIEMLDGMLEKGKKEKYAEEVSQAAFKQFCDDTATEKSRDISEANEKIDMLKADIEKYISEAERLTKEIAVHDEDISVWNGDMKAATKVRDIEKADYAATHQDYSESIDALNRAIAVLKKQAYDRKQKSFVQVSALTSLNLIPDDAKKAINTFLAQDEPESADSLEETESTPGAPEANAYDFQSHGIIDMLEKLLDKFTAELTELEKQERESISAYQLLIQDLKAQITQATADRTEKAKAKAQNLMDKAEAESDLEDTTAVRDSDSKYLTELEATCEQKKGDFEARQELRAQEIEAIEKAIEIISSEAVSGNADKHLPTLVQNKATSLSQLRTDGSGNTQARVVQFLQSRATQLNSRILSALATRVASDPFAKVKKMIKDLITRLMEEATEEADHKSWCDTELSVNEQTRKEKTASVEELHAQIDVLEAEIAKLTEEISDLTKAVAELDAAMAKATTIRQEEKATNTETIGDSEEAQKAVAMAITVLKDFYAKAAEATALMQVPGEEPEIPEIYSTPYKGMQAENGGVIGMLEVIQSDFARLEADTKSAEALAQKEYDTFMADSQADKESKNTEIEHKIAKKQDANQDLTLRKEDLEGTQKELEAALAYFDKLKPSCIDVGVSYESRVARRKEEIASLQEALKILSGEELAAPSE